MNKNLLISFIVIVIVWLAVQYDFDTYIIPPSAILPDGGQYYGELKEDKFTGEGKIIWTNGRSYRGAFKNGLFSGIGKMVSVNGNVYEGQFIEGELSGQGNLKTVNGNEYKGQFKSFMPDGYGRWQFGQGSSYVGYFKKNKYHGAGTLTIKESETYIGTFEEGRYQGEGYLIYNNGISYRGQFNKGMYHGQGIYKTSKDDRFEGDFVESTFSGTGVYEDASGNLYQGEFKDWKYDGKGKYSSEEGDEYEGEFVQGSLKGEGVFKGKDGQVYHGQFKNWRFHGKGELLKANGDRYQGDFEYGSPNGKGVLGYAAPKDGETKLTGKWSYGRYIGDGNGPDRREANTEKALYNQNQLIQTTIDQLRPSEKDKINLYFVAIAGDGKQDVFYKEVSTIREIFDQSFDTQGRSAIVANNPKTVDSIALATTTSVEQVLRGVSEKMDRQRDILFIYLTSHGSKNHEFSLDQEGLSIPDLPAKRLAKIVNKLPIKWKVVVISACYSGGFIPELESKTSLIITAAAHDRKSFGCSDDADMTYFGRAFFLDALAESNSFVSAFEMAKELVIIREKEIIAEDKSKHSNPEISKPKAITNYLKKWRTQLKSQHLVNVSTQVNN